MTQNRSDHDREVRPRLLEALAPVASWVRQECHLGTGSRIDVAAIVGGEVVGYEIKASRDSLRRLVPPDGFQVAEFSLNYDRVTLVCAECHLAAAVALIPAWWGVTRAEDLVEVRPAAINPSDAVGRLARLLWVGELRALAKELSLPTRGTDKRRLANAFAAEHEGAMRRALSAALVVRRWGKIQKQVIVRYWRRGGADSEEEIADE